ncbi:MAG TPA: heat-inducible transcriptional repressor HrcA [Solirubrobacteraceae bacterium]|jgi:heat-inducible transcriptional repressor|nr:heat-inducible transcriptional repressor HrcA [Solirubrobacteraceae bacterium]
MLTPRQETILRKVVETYAETGQPIASKTLAADPSLDCGPSTIRYELAQLEAQGLLEHPHTSAGRVPTDAGRRSVVDRLLASNETRPAVATLDLTAARRELDHALRVTTERLSEITNLLAVATAPAIDSATIHRIEVLTLQPSVVMVVSITSSGSISKFVSAFDEPIDPGLVAWAGAYLNERVGGLPLGARILLGRLADPELGHRERAFIDRLAPAFGELASGGEDVLFVDGTSRLLGAQRFAEPGDASELIALLERRVVLLEVMRRALSESGVYVRIGTENEVPGLQSLSVVASGYGLAQRRLGTVSVIGPVRMDYAVAIDTVRAVARQLSRFVQDVY